MAIDKAKVYNRVNSLAKTGTSGYDDQDEYNGKTYAAELRLVEMLADVYESNTKASDALNWLIKDADITSGANGLLTLPNDYLHLSTIQLKVGANLYPTDKIRTNELGMVRTSPIRGMNLTKNKIGYYFKQGNIYTLPEQAGIVARTTYISKPVYSTIVLTEASDADSDFLTVSGGVDFGWPDSLFNIIVYLILEQLGVELKDQWLLEFANYGITIETVKAS